MITANASLVIVVAQLLALIVLVLSLAAMVVRSVRRTRDARRRVAEKAARPLVMEALSREIGDDQPAPQVSHSVGRTLDSLALNLAGKVRGGDREALVQLLYQRGTITQARRGLRSWRPIQRLRSVELLGSLTVPEFLPELAERLQDRNPDVRRAAVRAVGRTAAVDSVPVLLFLLDTATRWVPEHCVTLALLRSGDTAAPHLVAALVDRGPRARRAAAQVLGWQGEITAVGPLCDVLNDESTMTRLAAIEALGRIGSPAAAEPLRALLGPGHPAEVRVAAAAALGRLGDPANAEALSVLLTEDHQLARTAATALAGFGPVGETHLSNASAISLEALEALGDRSRVVAAAGGSGR